MITPAVGDDLSTETVDKKVAIKISVTVCRVLLEDTIETELSQLLCSHKPEHIATTLCNDLGLGIIP